MKRNMFPECPICYQKYSQDSYSLQLPKLLSCGHSLCLECCQALPETLTDPGRKLVSCPQCRKATTVEIKVGFTTNFALADFIHAQLEDHNNDELNKRHVDMVHVSGNDAKDLVKCSNCEQDDAADGHCLTCTADICANCWTQTHSSKLFQKHQKVSVGEARKRARRSASHKCVTHSERNSLYCLSCKCMICVICRDFGSHKGHTVDTVSSIGENYRTVLEGKMRRLKKSLDSIALLQMKLNDSVVMLQKSGEVSKVRVMEGIKALHEALDQRAAHLLLEISQYEENGVKLLSSRKEEISCVSTEVSTTISKCQEILEDADDQYFLQGYRQLFEKTEELLGNIGKFAMWSELNSIPVSVDFNSLKVHVNRLGIVSKSLDGVVAGEIKPAAVAPPKSATALEDAKEEPQPPPPNRANRHSGRKVLIELVDEDPEWEL
eukprot:TRINITY_DN16375_c0_g1_i1.p1 TRINITY_DN16375_c0_g1~~TRINITY_DN16375_c0_g1_i1.p1  ORF type:complete len:436 (-),score=76.57 TRINITY_DN16375_c0_g1_i1:31-1338(-)